MDVVPVNQHEDLESRDLTSFDCAVVLDDPLPRVWVQVTPLGAVAIEVYDEYEVEVCSVQSE